MAKAAIGSKELVLLFIVTPIVGVCNCSMFWCTLLYVHCSIAIILKGKRELVALLNLSSWCLLMVEGLFLAVPRGCLRFEIVVFPDHTHLLFLVLVQPRKTRPFKTERLLMGHKETNQTNKSSVCLDFDLVKPYIKEFL